MTAAKKKGKYIYYRCTGFKGACGNTYIREERLADLLGHTIAPIQITPEIAAVRQLAQRRRTVVSKLDRGYDDFISAISEELWKRKSANGMQTFEPSRPNWPASSSLDSQF